MAFNSRRLVYSRANRGDYIDFAAPGLQIWAPTPGGDGRYLSGTSLAAQFVSVLAALHTAKARKLTAEKLRHVFRQQTVDLGAKGKFPSFCYELVNIQPKCV